MQGKDLRKKQEVLWDRERQVRRGWVPKQRKGRKGVGEIGRVRPRGADMWMLF